MSTTRQVCMGGLPIFMPLAQIGNGRLGRPEQGCWLFVQGGVVVHSNSKFDACGNILVAFLPFDCISVAPKLISVVVNFLIGTSQSGQIPTAWRMRISLLCRQRHSSTDTGSFSRRPALGAGASLGMAWGPVCCWDRRWESLATEKK